MLVYDVTSSESFEKLGKWVDELYTFCGNEKELVIFVVGNKNDIQKREVIEGDAREWAQSQGYPYFETSAQSGEGVVEMFSALFSRVVQATHDPGLQELQGPDGVRALLGAPECGGGAQWLGEERQSLLHDSTPATISAFVQLDFDNSDNRFPTDKKVVSLRRSIGIKKDEYSLDKKSVPKSDVANLLEAAGFSKSNPYYIVPQGRVTALTNAKDAERLTLLKDVAGTKVYETRRADSLKIMDETTQKREKINELLDYIEDRLNELEEEKEELKQFQEMDRERRCLEYAIYYREQMDVNEQLDELDELRKTELDNSSQITQVRITRELELAELEKKIGELQQQHQILTVAKNSLDEERKGLVAEKARLDVEVDELIEKDAIETGKRKQWIEELRETERQIEAKESDLNEVTPKYNNALTDERSSKQELSLLEQEQSHLFSKQGRLNSFRSVSQRNQYLDTEIVDLTATIAAESEVLQDLNNTLTAERRKVGELERQIEEVKVESEEVRERLVGLDKRVEEVLKERGEVDERKKELWREDAKNNLTLNSLKDELRKVEREVYGTMDKATASGLKALNRIVKQNKIDGVHGPLYSLFKVDERYRTAVEVIGGTSLFHVVVETDEIAARLVEIMTREKSGRLTFMPLNRMKVKEVNFTDAEDALPIVPRLRFDRRFEKAFKQVFGKAVICPTLEIASAYARGSGLTAVTFEGDRADRKGALTGGFINYKNSRIECTTRLQDTTQKITDLETNLTDIKISVDDSERRVLALRDTAQKLETERTLGRERRKELYKIGVEVSREVDRVREGIRKKEISVQNLETSIRNMNATKELYEREKTMPLTNSLTGEEVERLEYLTGRVQELREESVRKTTERFEVEKRKKEIEFELEQNLRRKRQELEGQLDAVHGMGGGDEMDLGEEEGNVEVENRRKEGERVAERLGRLVERLETIETEIEENTSLLTKHNNDYEKLKSQQTDDKKALERQHRSLEKYTAKKAMLLKRKEEINGNIREVGVLPGEAFEKYKDTALRTLVSNLHKVNEGLKKFSHVNKKAFEQYNNFTKQRDSLLQRKEDLDSSAKAIEDLVAVLDQRKDDAIQRTFAQVSANFSEVWEKLVPAGRGELIMLKYADAQDGASEQQEEEEEEEEEEPSEEEEEETASRRRKGKSKAKPKKSLTKSKRNGKTSANASAIESYSGIAISVSFHSKTNEGLRMAQLSGGQKSLVALALIFAIQQCDPAPFYLFDEIDAALDAQYRTAVAEMINELSENAQFIMTTFRPELLQFATNFYGVTFIQKVSKIQEITQDEATQFIQDEQP
ncbi:Structural maintenance of chromosomes protein 3, partial [Nowakowskiella sp. JEL0407]